MPRPVKKRFIVALAVLILGAFVSQAARAQDLTQPSTSDLAAAAKRTREERAQQSAQRTSSSAAVDEMAAQLADESDQPIGGAPIGYRYYFFKPGNYAILVPVDASADRRDYQGLRLISSQAITSSIEVILGDPIIAQGNSPEEIIHNASRRYFYDCNSQVSMLGAPVAGHPTSSISGFYNCSLNHEILGTVEFVLANGYVMPIACGYPYRPEDLKPNPYAPVKKVLEKYDREQNGFNVCKLILPSVKFDTKAQPALTEVSAPAKPAMVTAALVSSPPVEPAIGGSGTSLGSFARVNKKTPAAEVVTELQHAAPGYLPYSFSYCTSDECFRASIQVPAKARKNEQYRVDYIGLFEFDVPVGDSFAVIEAITGPPTKLGFLTREQFINTKVDWYLDYGPAHAFSHPAKAEILHEGLTELSGIPARVATYRSQTATQPVMTHMAAYFVPGKFVQLRCSVPEKDAGDAQSMCEHVVQSLEIPDNKGDRNRAGGYAD